MDRKRIGRIAGFVVLWLITAFEGLSLGLAGRAKFTMSEFWGRWFEAWGYGSGWFLTLIGVGEIVGALLLLIPRTAPYGAATLIVIMLGALYTVTTKEAGQLLPGPVVSHLVMLGVILWFRRPRRHRPGTTP